MQTRIQICVRVFYVKSLPLMREVDGIEDPGRRERRQKESLPQSFCFAKIQPPRQRGPANGYSVRYNMKISKSAYFDSFRCLADRCPDSCCHEWDVLVDDASAARYRALPGPLGDHLRRVMTEEDGQVFMALEQGRCPMWRGDGLCRIQAQLGHESLCKTCREFPRLRHDYGDFVELGLELSCPEAARLILTQPFAPRITEEIPGGEDPEYDAEAMTVLLQTREEALKILQDTTRSVGETLAIFLLYGVHAQELVDGGAGEFDPETALDAAREFAAAGESGALPAFYLGLELLTDRWRKRLEEPASGAWSEMTRAFACYCVERYWLQAVSDYDLVSRIKMTVAACLLLRTLGGDFVETAQLYSKEIENSAENVDAILDATYESPAFADNKLLGLLLL